MKHSKLLGFEFPRTQVVLSLSAFALDFDMLVYLLVDRINLLMQVIYISNIDKILIFKEMAICTHLTNSIFLSVFRLVDLIIKKIGLLIFLRPRVSFTRQIEIAYHNIVMFALADFLNLKM